MSRDPRARESVTRLTAITVELNRTDYPQERFL